VGRAGSDDVTAIVGLSTLLVLLQEEAAVAAHRVA